MGQVRYVQRTAVQQQLAAGNIVLLTNVGVSAAGELLNCNAYDASAAPFVRAFALRLRGAAPCVRLCLADQEGTPPRGLLGACSHNMSCRERKGGLRAGAGKSGACVKLKRHTVGAYVPTPRTYPQVATHAAVELKADKLLCLTLEDVRELKLPHYLPLASGCPVLRSAGLPPLLPALFWPCEHLGWAAPALIARGGRRLPALGRPSPSVLAEERACCALCAVLRWCQDDAEALITSSVCEFGDAECLMKSLDALDHASDAFSSSSPDGGAASTAPSSSKLRELLAGGAGGGGGNGRSGVATNGSSSFGGGGSSSGDGSSGGSSSEGEGGSGSGSGSSSLSVELQLDLDSWQQIGYPNAVLAAVVACKNGVKRAHLIDAERDVSGCAMPPFSCPAVRGCGGSNMLLARLRARRVTHACCLCTLCLCTHRC